ncbi:hypothetical protein ACU60T_23460 [Klebsiella aerogenes]
MKNAHLLAPDYALRNASPLFPLVLLPCDTGDDPDEPALIPVPMVIPVPDNQTLHPLLSSLVSDMDWIQSRSHEDGYEIVHLALPLQRLRDMLTAIHHTDPDSPLCRLADHLLAEVGTWKKRGAISIQLQIPQRHSVFNTEAQIWGHEHAPHAPRLIRKARRLTGGQCDHCGYRSPHNGVCFRDGNPDNTHHDNLGMACPVCMLGQHLNKLDAASGVMVYLPGLPASDLSHLLRTTFLARHQGDERQKQGAKQVMAWLITHRAECEAFWGTSHPGEFGEALLRLPADSRDDLQQRLRHVALIPNPALFKDPSLFSCPAPDGWLELFRTWQSA